MILTFVIIISLFFVTYDNTFKQYTSICLFKKNVYKWDHAVLPTRPATKIHSQYNPVEEVVKGLEVKVAAGPG